jgi:hypothetical protein
MKEFDSLLWDEIFSVDLNQQQKRAKAAVEGRFKKLQNFKQPSYRKIKPLAEELCQTLFEGYDEILKLVEVERVYNEHGELECIGDLSPMSLDDLEELIQEAELEKWGEVRSVPGIPEINHRPRNFFFLERLFTGQHEDEGETGYECEFLSFKDAFDRGIGQMMDCHYPDNSVSLAKSQAEREYYCKHYTQEGSFREMEHGIRLQIYLESCELFHRYLASQDWRRFIEPVRAIIARAD